MRVTAEMFHDRFLSNMHRNMEAIFKAHEQLSSGKRVNRPSDDPTAMSRIVAYRTEISAIGLYKSAIVSATTSLEAMDSAFFNLNDIMIRARELALAGATATADAGARRMMAVEVNVLLESAIGVANTKVAGRYVFSGFQSDIPPINANTGEFVADRNTITIDISPDVAVGINIPAYKLFSFTRTDPNDPLNAILPPYNHNFDIAVPPATPPDADPISALHTAVGVNNPGEVNSGSPLGGTLTITVGEGDTTPVEIAVASGASLNDIRDAINAANAGVKADIVNFGVADYRLVIASDQVGQSGDIRIVVDSPADPQNTGLHRLAYDPLGVQNMTLGRDIPNYNYITDTTNPNFYSFNNNHLNESNILRALHFLKVSLEANDTGRIQKAIDYIGRTSEMVHQLQAEVGSRLSKLDREGDYLADRQHNTTMHLSRAQDADIAKLVSDVAQRQAALHAMRAVTAEFMGTSLFDFIR
ncbi:flagellar hook-associated protein FlgL [Thermodesulfovibrionales bacterium]|nr:flagellar hook-associated protein FlgL [Thermodesulfovibrionales bacterium]MCL0086634.1 flagellar hook-associated protein FlgL [Thermodesulfovibrionales bacterium]